MTYRVERRREGVYEVLDSDGDRLARVARFMPRSMVSVDGQRIVSTAGARAIAEAMIALSIEIDSLKRRSGDD